jgi:hypothetical protein
MAKQTKKYEKEFNQLETLLKPYEKVSRSPSCDFLTWFLETIYRLDDIEARDAICDTQDDGGIDGITVDEPSRSIVLFQSKRREKPATTLGDKDLKHFVGSVSQFRTKKNVEALIKSAKIAPELKARLVRLKISEKVADGYRILPLFATNVPADEHATAYLGQLSDDDSIDLWDLSRLAPVLEQIDHDWFVSQASDLHADGSVMEFGTKGAPDLVFAAVSARQLIKLPGISDTR